MKQLLEFLPLVIFVVVFKLSGTTLTIAEFDYTFDGIYTATLALIVATLLQVILVKVIWGSVEKRLLAVAALVLVFGSATVLLRDPVFILWKPTVLNWTFAAVCAGWHLVRHRCLFEALLPSEIELPQSAWLKVTIVSTFQFLMVGALNLYVGFNYSMDTWVTYKLWSPLALTIPWMILLGIIMGPHIKNAQKAANDETTISP